jgi:RNA polymerase sigma factor (sigma-70 family)
MAALADEFDIDLLGAAQHGDKEAFAELFRRHGPIVLKYAWARVKEMQLAEDVSQETFVVAWMKRSKAQIVDESLLPWLLTVCRNVSSNALRRRTRERVDELPENATAPTSREELVWLKSELARLSDVDRKICELCLVQGMSYSEAAGLMDLTQAAVGKRLQRARARLRVALGEDN